MSNQCGKNQGRVFEKCDKISVVKSRNARLLSSITRRKEIIKVDSKNDEDPIA